MTKKLLPAMIGVVLAGGMAAAQADVQVFGHIDESINYIDGNISPYVDKGDEDTRFICTTCSIGFKGSEDLGNGLKAIFKLDFQYDINNRNRASDGNNSLFDRDQWIGMGSNFGKLRVGTISTTYKSTGAMLDPGYRTVAQMRDAGIQSVLHRGAGSNGEGRAENTVRYDSPSWNGLKFNGTYTLSPDSNATADNNGYSAGLQYENGGILVFTNYITNDAGGDDDAYKLGAKWSFNNFAVFGQYEFDGGLITDGYNGTLDSGNGTDGDGADLWMLGGSYAFGNNLIYASYAQGDNSDIDPADIATGAAVAFVSDDYAAMEIVGVHNLSKRTLLYGGFVYVDFDADELSDNDLDDDIKHYTLGVKHKF